MKLRIYNSGGLHQGRPGAASVPVARVRLGGAKRDCDFTELTPNV